MNIEQLMQKMEELGNEAAISNDPEVRLAASNLFFCLSAIYAGPVYVLNLSDALEIWGRATLGQLEKVSRT